MIRRQQIKLSEEDTTLAGVLHYMRFMRICRVDPAISKSDGMRYLSLYKPSRIELRIHPIHRAWCELLTENELIFYCSQWRIRPWACTRHLFDTCRQIVGVRTIYETGAVTGIIPSHIWIKEHDEKQFQEIIKEMSDNGLEDESIIIERIDRISESEDEAA